MKKVSHIERQRRQNQAKPIRYGLDGQEIVRFTPVKINGVQAYQVDGSKDFKLLSPEEILEDVRYYQNHCM